MGRYQLHLVTVFEELVSQNTGFRMCINSALPLFSSLFKLSHGGILDMFISVHVYSFRFVSQNTDRLFYKYKLEDQKYVKMAGSTKTCILVHCLSWITLLTRVRLGVLSKGWSVVVIFAICCNSCAVIRRLNAIVCLTYPAY